MSSVLIEQPDSPQIEHEGDRKQIVRVYKIPHGYDPSEDLPRTGEPTADGYFLKYRIQSGPGYDTLVTISSDKKPEGGSAAIITNKKAEYTPSTSVIEKQLSEHPDYRTIWEYNLYSTNKDETGVESWVDNATDLSTPDDSYWRWSKTHPGDGWYLIRSRSKSADAYVYPAHVTVERIYCWKKKTAEAYLHTVGKRKAPPSDGLFGYPGGADHWLVMSSELEWDGKYWIAVTRYQYGDQIDTDLYEEA